MRHFILHASLIHGWLPVAVQLVAAVAAACAIGWRSRRWRSVWIPVMAVGGAMLALAAHWYLDSLGVAGDPAPPVLWVWIAATGLALGVLIVGWHGAQWWRRGLSVLAVPLCALSAALAINLWVGYFPTVNTAWNQITAGPLPDQTDRMTVTEMQLAGITPIKGVVVPVNIPDDASKFHHRQELIYLPPAWFASNPAPRLPTVMMIGAALGIPADWIRAANAVHTIDEFAAAHGGNAPVLVFADATGGFNNDTECVNGSRGNAADHLIKDVVPYMISNFRVSADRANWGIAGWSMGGTCAVDLTVMHPDLFAAFVDIAGDAAPNAGTKDQTIAALFGGNPAAYAAYEPTNVIARHGRYQGVYGWFDIPGSPQAQRCFTTRAAPGAVAVGSHDRAANPEAQDIAADSLCTIAGAHGIRSAVVAQPGRHDWPFAAQAFAAALPWLAGRLGTPDVATAALPGLVPETMSQIQATSAAPAGHGAAK